jgi:DNA transformation protein and related proteins
VASSDARASEYIEELFAAFGPVSVRRLFGGAGLYADGVMFAIFSHDFVYLKADDTTAEAFKREGCGPFTYATKEGERSLGSYWRIPDRLYDDSEELARWATAALAVARRESAMQGGKSRKRKRPRD